MKPPVFDGKQNWWNPRQNGKGKGGTVSEIATESWPEDVEQNLIFAVVQSDDEDSDSPPTLGPTSGTRSRKKMKRSEIEALSSFIQSDDEDDDEKQADKSVAGLPPTGV